MLAGFGLELAGRAGARLAGTLGIAVHPSTVLRLVMALSAASAELKRPSAAQTAVYVLLGVSSTPISDAGGTLPARKDGLFPALAGNQCGDRTAGRRVRPVL